MKVITERIGLEGIIESLIGYCMRDLRLYVYRLFDELPHLKFLNFLDSVFLILMIWFLGVLGRERRAC